MGLAASQARFLLLTSRATDIQSQMQAVSAQRLAISRQSSDLSTRHANAMNAQNVMFNYIGLDENGKQKKQSKELQYSDLMYEGSDYLITNAYGAVMLDDKMKALLGKVGVTADSGTGDDLAGVSLEQFLTSACPGKEKEIAEVLDAERKLNMGSDAVKDTKFTTYYDIYNVLSYAGGGKSQAFLNDYKNNRFATLINDTQVTGNNWNRYESGKAASAYMNELKSGDGYDKLVSQYNSQSTNWGDGLKNGLLQALCGPALDKGLCKYRAEIEAACDYAKAATDAKFMYYLIDENSRDYNPADNTHAMEGRVLGGGKASTLDLGDLEFKDSDDEKQRINTIDFYHSINKESLSWGKTETTTRAGVDISCREWVNTYLAFFDKYCDENFSDKDAFDQLSKVEDWHSYVVSDVAGANGGRAYGGTTPIKYVGAMCTVEGRPIVETENLDPTVVYYRNLYKQLKEYGWQTNRQLSKSDYVQQQIIYGNLQLKKFNGFECDRLSLGDKECPLSFEDDEEAIEKENIRYQAELDVLNYKETLLDTMMKDLEDEYNAIDSEKSSIEEIIQNNIKMFTLFDA